MYHFMLFPFGTKGLYTESIKSPACSIICHKLLHATTNGNWWLLVVTIHALLIFSQPLSPCKLRSHVVRKMGLEPIRSYEHYPLKVTRLPFRHSRIIGGLSAAAHQLYRFLFLYRIFIIPFYKFFFLVRNIIIFTPFSNSIISN